MDPLCMRRLPLRRRIQSGKICFSSCRKPKPSMRRYGATPARVLTPDSLRLSFRTRVLARLAQRFGPRFVLPAIAATEFADRDKYAHQSRNSPALIGRAGHAASRRCRASRRAHRRRYREGGTLARARLRQRAARSRPGRERWSNVEPVPGHGNGRRRSAVAHYHTGAHLYPSFVLIVLHSRYH